LQVSIGKLLIEVPAAAEAVQWLQQLLGEDEEMAELWFLLAMACVRAKFHARASRPRFS